MPNPYILLLRTLSKLPWRLLHAFGWLVGLLFWLLSRPRRRVACINLGLCLPEASEAERRRLLRRSFVAGGRYLAECGKVWLGDWRKLERRIDAAEFQREVARLRADGRGLILATPHIGNWEVAGLWCGQHMPMTSLYEPQEGEVETLIKAARERTGARLAPADTRGVRAALTALRRGEVVGILPDQQVRLSNGVYADFFGVPAPTMTIVGKLAAKTNARLYIGWAERLPSGRGFKMRLRAADSGYDDPDPVHAATALNASIAAVVRDLPEQYWWSYQRFRRNPGPGPSVYKLRT